ncbi:hypothetical protein IWW36_003491 [Coemansia brasiliensis]|uniref:SART-1 protein n=1 Tax=Coemansia brasiliensis TaxID=2650707 RepID=A0A9W8M012_9FUNG|nr:hypothetical protein IWW36_003491 [Coemansia brasiliensis]
MDESDGNGASLESSLLADRERARKNAQRQQRKHPLYGLDTAHAVVEEEEEEANKPVLTISAGGRIDGSNQQQESAKPGAETLDSETPLREISDYYTPEEAAKLFKKSRKRDKKKSKRMKTSTTNDFGEVDTERVNALLTQKSTGSSVLFDDNDDDDLQRAIAAVRKAKQAKKPKDSEVSDMLLNDSLKNLPQDLPVEENSDLVLSGTIEFVQGLKAAMQSEVKPNEEAEEEEEEARVIKRTKQNDSSTAPEPKRGMVADSRTAPKVPLPKEVIEPEPTIGMGLAGTLGLLKQRNMLDGPTEEQLSREQQQRSREQWMAEHRRQEKELQAERQRIKQLGKQQVQERAARKSDKRRGKPDAMTQRELEEMKQREQEALDRKWAREYEERMRDYKPDVKLEYVDETGRQLTTKEAYKQMSHAFHGHYSGKNKIDKIIKKRQREQRQQQQASSANTHERGAAMENARRKVGSAGFVFSDDA